MEEWGTETNFEAISIEDADKLVQEYSEKRADYEAKNKLAKEAYAEVEELKMKIVALLDSANKSSWQLEGIGKVTKTKRTSPKVVDKVEMLKHFRSLGEEAYLSYVSVNSRTLGAFIKQEQMNDPEFSMPGVEVAEIPNISFTRSKK